MLCASRLCSSFSMTGEHSRLMAFESELVYVEKHDMPLLNRLRVSFGRVLLNDSIT